MRDCGPLFDILAGDDGLITIREFCKGVMQLKGQARALDIVRLGALFIPTFSESEDRSTYRYYFAILLTAIKSYLKHCLPYNGNWRAVGSIRPQKRVLTGMS